MHRGTILAFVGFDSNSYWIDHEVFELSRFQPSIHCLHVKLTHSGRCQNQERIIPVLPEYPNTISTIQDITPFNFFQRLVLLTSRSCCLGSTICTSRLPTGTRCTFNTLNDEFASLSKAPTGGSKILPVAISLRRSQWLPSSGLSWCAGAWWCCWMLQLGAVPGSERTLWRCCSSLSWYLFCWYVCEWVVSRSVESLWWRCWDIWIWIVSVSKESLCCWCSTLSCCWYCCLRSSGIWYMVRDCHLLLSELDSMGIWTLRSLWALLCDSSSFPYWITESDSTLRRWYFAFVSLSKIYCDRSFCSKWATVDASVVGPRPSISIDFVVGVSKTCWDTCFCLDDA